ncbi:hypothetical protein F4782DRAFT_539160 [Xylaria castorea]|nr:hypothetical protein F4782DRAFT_539160 [Xylaria castorea]
MSQMTASNSLGSSSKNESNGVLISPTRSKWEQALQRLIKEYEKQFHLLKKSLGEPRKVLDDVLAAANERKEECVRKRWRLVINGRTIYIRDVLEKISVWVKKLVTIGDIAIQYDPVHAALPWAAVRLIMQTSINDLETFGHVIVSLENLTSIIAQCHIIETVYLGNRKSKTPELADQLNESIVNLYAAILRYLADIIQYLASSTRKRILKSIGHSQEDFQAKYLPVKNALEDFGRLAGISQAANLVHGLDLIESIDKQLSDINDRDESGSRWLQEIDDGLEQENRVRILRAISNIPYGTHHKTARKGRVEGSGAWLLKKPEFREWRTSSFPSVLWLHGIPGSGKTKLTSLVIDEVLGHEHVAYFYCMRNPAEPQRAQCDRILGSLVRQLASVGPNRPILRPVVKCYEDAIEGAGEFEDHAWTIDESVAVLVQLFDEYPAVTLVLDALDEVNQESRQELLDALGSLIRLSTSLVRIFISSRSNYDIALSLVGAPNIYIGANDNADDILSFIDKKLTEVKLLRGNLSPGLRTIIANTLKDGAQGMFRWVDLQIQSLRPLKVAADVRTRLGTLPATLEASYWEVFQEIRDSGDNALALATFTIQWLLYSQEPMSLDGFAALASVAFATELDNKYTAVEVIYVCSNLIVKRESSFEFAHLSVREFFEKLNKRRIDTYLPEEGNAALAQACLLFLNQALVPSGVIRERATKFMYSRGLEIECEEKTEGYGQIDSTEVEIKPFPVSWTEEYVISSDIGGGVPSNYVVTWMVYHVNAAGSLRLKPALGDLLKAFVLQPTEPILKAPSGRITCRHTVAPSFYAWYHLSRLPYVNVGRYFYMQGELVLLPGSPIWLACELRWLELVEYLYRNPYDTIDKAQPMYHLDLGAVEVNPFWYAIATGRTDVANCIAASTGNKKQTFSEKGGLSRLLEHAGSYYDATLIRTLAKLHPGDREAALNEAIRLIIKPPSTSIEKAVRVQARPDYLATACANGSVEDAKSFNREHRHTVYSGHVEVARLLLEKHIELGGISTALIVAISKGDSEITNMLVQYGGRRARHFFKAIERNRPQLALRLVSASYEVNGWSQNPSPLLQGRTALHIAVIMNHCEVVKALLAHQAEVNVPDLYGWTPLHIAIDHSNHSNRCEECIKTLIEGGADLLAKNLFGHTALQLAQRSRLPAIIDLIERRTQDSS